MKNLRDSKGRFWVQHASFSDPSDVRAFEGFGNGDTLQFSVIVCAYQKGYLGDNYELRLTHPLGSDYGFQEVKDLQSLSYIAKQGKRELISLIQELNTNKRISMGVC